MTPIYMRVYNPALGKWAVACCEQPDPDGAPSRYGAAVRWTHDPAVATVLESHAAEALAEALVGISRKLGLGWDQVYAERTR
jgi:hypothetical protein